MPSLLPSTHSRADSITDKLIKLEGSPWKHDNSSDGRGCDGERLQAGIIGCVTKLGYRLSMDITLDMSTNTRVFFLIKTSGDDTGCLVTVPNNSPAGLGEKETLCVYRPLLVRHKSSFFRSYHGRGGSIRKKLQASMRRKVVTKNHEEAMSEPAWWQQTSTDCSNWDIQQDIEDIVWKQPLSNQTTDSEITTRTFYYWNPTFMILNDH